ncbi:phospholipid carrier-dependent glycosyltransferase [Cohnella endophytica]|uniref:Polyprenol-phosphate-mannose--protein mannosyltransferase n=1 Tax=Cohnella endophytica TaxID=2419778 RepID=A0A494YD13_9BACL|nr:phospholipid carrier-dependent glycosyltransferase [Cohnella endophytica]RKP58171.1 phospholipid carrier-dependent glycosyltransferase [Cohnella endophytica]
MNKQAKTSAIIGFSLFLLLLIALLFPAASAFAENGETNLVINGSFEEVNADEPTNWSKDAYLAGDENSLMKVVEGDAHSGSRFATIESFQPNDAKWVQTVSVQPDSLYKLSCWVRVVQAGEGATGANISVLGIGTTSRDLTDSAGGWENVELVGRTGAGQNQITVAVRLGGYGSLNAGRADFDDFRMEKLDEAPAGAVVVPFEPAADQGAASGSESVPSHSGFSGWMIFYGVAYAAMGVYLLSRYRNRSTIASDKAPEVSINRTWLVIVVFGGAFLLRLVCAPMLQGHPIDIFDFMAWADQAYRNGLSNFYNGQVFADYPPGYIYVLYVLGLIKSWFGLAPESSASIILIKFPAMVADLVTGWFIYKMALRLWDEKTALLAALLYVLNPLVFLDSVLWGQMDSVFCLLVVLMLLFLHKQKLTAATVLFVIAILIKPQSLIFAPLLLLSIRFRKETLNAAIYGLFAFVAITLPFSIREGPLWIFKHYKAMFGLYPYATFNAFNGYALLGANGVETSQKWWGITFATWDVLAIAIIVLIAGFFLLRSRREGNIFYAAFLIALLVFAFKTGLHERYGYATVPLALMCWLRFRDTRVFALFLGVSITNFANVAYVLKFGLRHDYFIPNGNGFMNLVAFTNVCLAIYAVWVGYELLIKKTSVVQDKGIKSVVKPGVKTGIKTRIKTTIAKIETPAPMIRRDYLAMTVITVVYAAIALFQLGSSVAPQSFWKPVSQGESAIADFGSAQQVGAIEWYGGIGNGSFQIESSEDRQTWTLLTNIDLNDGTVFQWKKIQASVTTRYVKIESIQPGAALGEMAFLGADQKLISLVGEGLSSPAFDEQRTVPIRPSYLNSMYFDEIYHARTAYENLHHMEPYESTHPPLGKVIISAGVAILGMNPFGWRIAGVLFGIAIVPLMYLFGKRLFRETRYAALASILIAFDFMLFTQSRLATVDTFAVFFILLAYERMHRYYVMNFYKDKLLKTLAPLALSGLAFGLASATKWIGLYAGAGLAILFFLSLWKRYKEYQGNRQLLFGKNALWTLLSCGLFFIVVPLMIYTASYIPFMLVPGAGHGWKNVISYQKFMFDYHSKLNATHPFSSTWWEWPIIRKPIWYYGSSELAPGKMSSIVAMGNPAVWWAGTIAAIATFRSAWKRKNDDMTVVLVGILAAYVPWVLVSRLTFIYHFFACVPFLVLCIVYWIRKIEEGNPLYRKWTHLYTGAVVLLFVLYYPILSGTEIYVSYADGVLKWFKGWIFHG